MKNCMRLTIRYDTKGMVFIGLQEPGKGIFYRIGRVGWHFILYRDAVYRSASR